MADGVRAPAGRPAAGHRAGVGVGLIAALPGPRAGRWVMGGITELEGSGMTGKPDTKAAKRQNAEPPETAAPAGGKAVMVGNLRELGGSRSDKLNGVLANQALNTVWMPRGADEERRKEQVSAVVAALAEFKPADGIEGMMAAQAVGLHSAAMECLRRAMIPEQSGAGIGPTAPAGREPVPCVPGRGGGAGPQAGQGRAPGGAGRARDGGAGRAGDCRQRPGWRDWQGTAWGGGGP